MNPDNTEFILDYKDFMKRMERLWARMQEAEARSMATLDSEMECAVGEMEYAICWEHFRNQLQRVSNT